VVTYQKEKALSGLGGKVATIGTGTIKFGENFHQSFTEMIFEAVNLGGPGAVSAVAVLSQP